MSKKWKILTLAVVSAAMFALPAVASAGTPVVDPGSLTFSGTFGISTLEAKEEPTFTCEGPNHMAGSYNAAGTGGTITLDYTNCHIVVLGFTIACKTEGAPLSNTIALSNVAFDNTYATDDKTKPAVLLTNFNTTIQCGSSTPTNFTGSVMGTITSPGCAGSATSTTLKFTATNNVQEHKQITGTGTKFDLLAETKGSGTKKTAGLNTEATVMFEKSGTLTCV